MSELSLSMETGTPSLTGPQPTPFHDASFKQVCGPNLVSRVGREALIADVNLVPRKGPGAASSRFVGHFGSSHTLSDYALSTYPTRPLKTQPICASTGS